jgi:cytochrome P450
MSDPTMPNLGLLVRDPGVALRSFHAAIERVVADNPLDSPPQPSQAIRQGRAVGAVIGFFLKFAPNTMLREIRDRGRLFQPAFGPMVVVEAGAVRELLERHQEFTVDPYGAEMTKVMTPQHNGGFTTFVLSTDDSAAYEPDKRLLTTVCTRRDAAAITGIVHEECVRRVGAAVDAARAAGSTTIDVVEAVARYVPVALGHRYLGVPVADEPGAFELTPAMLEYYGAPIDGQPETALAAGDGVIPDERQMYLWIKAAFQHFFNNVQKDPGVQVEGLRSCRLLLAYLLREIGIQRERLLNGEAVEDTMLTRLLRFQLGESAPGAERPDDLDPRLVSDLRIAENVMGTIVGAVAGQEEATCRVIDALVRLREGEYQTSGSDVYQYGTFEDAYQLALNVLGGSNAAESRAALRRYFLEALRLQPQGEVLLRKCVRGGAQIAGSRPIAPGTLIFASHGAAMQDVPEPRAFILNRPREHYLHYGWGRHACLGQHVSPVIIVETIAALLGLQDLSRPPAGGDEAAFPLERRFGRLQFDDNNLYATTFTLQFADAGTTQLFWPAAPASDHEVI